MFAFSNVGVLERKCNAHATIGCKRETFNYFFVVRVGCLVLFIVIEKKVSIPPKYKAKIVGILLKSSYI